MSCRLGFWPSSSACVLSLVIVFHFNPALTAIDREAPVLLWTMCPDDANYTAGSAFHTNLNLLLSSLSSSTTAAAGFHNDTIGRPPDQVYGLALCQGDLSLSECQACLNASVTNITHNCPSGMRSAIWFYQCMLRYSNKSFFSTPDLSFKVYERNRNDASDLQSFDEKLGDLMNSLAVKAARSSPKMFAVGNVNLTSFTEIYGLAQCTRDLYVDDCYRCIVDSVGRIPDLCNGKQGCKVFGQSCNIRYEIYPFFRNLSAADVASPPPPSTPVLPPPLLSSLGNEGK